VKQLYEPIELEQSHYTDFDQEVRVTDMPERFQLRTVPVCPTEDGELDDEAEWIYRQAFSTPPISRYHKMSTTTTTAAAAATTTTTTTISSYSSSSSNSSSTDVRYSCIHRAVLGLWLKCDMFD